MTAICQVVFLAFKPDASEEDLKEFQSKVLSLREDCLKPNETKPYIKSMRYGIDHGKFNPDETITHALVYEFENEEDRRYFMDEDPAHISISALGKRVVSQLQVIAFVPGSGGQYP